MLPIINLSEDTDVIIIPILYPLVMCDHLEPVSTPSTASALTNKTHPSRDFLFQVG